MKKLLMILVMLFWCNILYGVEIKDIDEVAVDAHWTGLDEQEAADICGQSDKFYFTFNYSDGGAGYIPSGKYIILCSREYLSYNPFYKGTSRVRKTNYLQSRKEDWDKKYNNKPEVIKNTLAKIKNICLEFGYKEGTEKLADCMKELYLKQTQPTTTIVQGTTTTTKPKRRIDPSVWDDILDVSKGLGEGKSVTEALGGTTSGTSKIQCFKIGERVSGTNQICSYDCMGSETTLNIASTRLCPLSIDYN